MIVDKVCNQQVLGCLMKHPQFLSEVDKYCFTLDDFTTRFEKYILTAIIDLYRSGATNISALEIDNYLNVDQTAHKIFEQNNGIEYLQDIDDFCQIENFPFYYNKFKKLNLLRDLKKQGIDISDFYIEDLVDPRADEVNANFEKLTTKDIIDGVRRKLIKLETAYVRTGEVEVESVADDIDLFLTDLDENYEIGVSIQGVIYNQVIGGAQPGALTIRSGSSGLGKTRQAVADACYLAYPTRFNASKGEWEQVGNNEKVLFIVTEQTFKQVRKMILAYLTDINESRFKYGHFSDDERKIITQAEDVINRFADNFILVKCPNPTIELIKTLVRENVLTRDIGYVFYDYIFIGPALLNEFRGFSLRNDEVLLMFATALKDLAVELNVAMFTSTQVNAQADDNRNIRNEASLAGGRSTINKADNGAIMARPTKEEIEILEKSNIISEFGCPNIVTDIFKVRSGQWTQVRIWSEVDLGRLRKKDLFITDARLDPIRDFFEEPIYAIENWDDEEKAEILNYVKGLNDGLSSNN